LYGEFQDHVDLTVLVPLDVPSEFNPRPSVLDPPKKFFDVINHGKI
jgi:hypothetical protein